MSDSTPIRRGILGSIPLFIPAIPFAFVFGVVVAESGIPTLLGWSSAPIIFGGAAQITLITLMGEGASVAAAVTAALIVGARHLLYSATMAPRFRYQPRWFQWLGAYMLIDQVFALTVLEKSMSARDFRHYYLSAGITFWLLWMAFTALGLVVGPVIPAEWQLGFAAPVLFMGLLAVSIDRWQKAAVALMAMIAMAALADLPNRLGIVVAALIAIAFGVLLERTRP